MAPLASPSVAAPHGEAASLEGLRSAGAAAFARGEHALAVREFSRALALAPADASLLCNRSAALLAAGGARDALRDAEEAERATLRADGAGTPLKPLYRQAQALAALELWDAVVAVCARALSVSPGHSQLIALLRRAAASGAEISGEAVSQALARASLSDATAQLAFAPQPSAAAAAASELDDSLGGSAPQRRGNSPAGCPAAGAPDEPSGEAYVADCRARGNEAFRLREYGQAVAWYTHGLRDAPEDAVLLSNRAAARLGLGQLRCAAADSARAAELQPRYLRGALRAALCHLRIGAYAEAREFCLQALDAQPASAHARALLEEVRTAEDRSAEVALLACHAAALAQAEEAAGAAPAGGAGSAHAAWHDVLEHSTLLLADAPLDSQLVAARARALSALGDWDGAALLVTRAREAGARGDALQSEHLACVARDGPLAEAAELASAALSLMAAPPAGAAPAGGPCEAPPAGEPASERTHGADGCTASLEVAAAPAAAAPRPPAERPRAAPAEGAAAAAAARERLTVLARRILVCESASRAARAAEVGAVGDEARARALSALAEALGACERGGAVEAQLRAREGALLSAGHSWAAAAAACSAGLRAGAARASSATGEGAAARKSLLLRRALCHAQLADHAAAAVDYADALRLDPSLTAARRGLAAAERALRLRATAGLYATLGVHVGVGEAELRRAYHSLALRWHPDRHAAGGEAARVEAEARFKEIAAAFETLSDPQSRARYDVDMHLRDGG